MSASHIVARASTPTEKRAVIERIHAAWCAKAGVRLGELIAGSCSVNELLYSSDTTLAELCENFAKEVKR